MTTDNPLHSFDATAARFEQEVLMRSMEIPVLADFWAEWCAPCKQLGPVLEKLAGEYNGAFVLAKVNADLEPQLVQVFGIRSLPTVMLLKGGQPVDGFMGAQPAAVVRELLTRHGIQPLPWEEPARTTVDPEQETAHLRAAIAAAPERDELKLDLAVALLKTGATEEAEALIDALPASLAQDDRAQRIKSQMELARSITAAPSVNDLRIILQHDPDNPIARHQLGVRLLLEGRGAEGLDQLIELLKRNRGVAGELARKTLLQAFRIIDDELLVSSYRRKMAALLF